MTDYLTVTGATNPAPGPYNTVDVGCGAGFHTYIVDCNGRKIGVVWGPRDEKVWTAALFAAAPDMLTLLKMILRGIERGKIKDQSLLRRNEEEIEIGILSERLRKAIARTEGITEGASAPGMRT